MPFTPLSIFAVSLAPGLWFVDDDAPGPGRGTFLDPYASIQFAIESPSTGDGDTILVAPGTYLEQIDFKGKTLILRSSAGADQTILDGDLSGTVVSLVSGEGPGSLVAGFTIRNGSSRIGAGVKCQGSYLALRDCVIESNAALDAGGAVHAEDANMTLRGCSLVSNSAEDFGAGIAATGSTLHLRNTLLLDNRSPIGFFPRLEGGGVWAQTSMVVIENCQLTSNEAGSGGAVCALDSALTLTGSVFNLNLSWTSGGALRVSGGLLDVVDCDLLSNDALTGNGGAIDAGTPGSILRCLIQDNWALEAGGGGASIFDDVLVDRCTFAENQAAGGGGAFAQAGTLTRFVGCTFARNVAKASAGGILGSANHVAERCVLVENSALGTLGGGEAGAVDGALELLNCVLYANWAALDAGGASRAALKNCVAWRNLPNDLGHDALATYSLIGGGWPGSGNIDAPPRFLRARDGLFQLLPWSPCIDAGDPTSPRDPDGSPVDMGAYPYRGLKPRTPVGR